jgi:hypothetical protein
MTCRISVLAVAIAAVGSGAFAQDEPTALISYTDAAPYSDLGPSGPHGTVAAAKSYWKGHLSRAEVIAALHEARINGTIPVGEAIGYPYPFKSARVVTEALPTDPVTVVTILGAGPDSDLTHDGYRFVGGEAGYVFVGRPGGAH